MKRIFPYVVRIGAAGKIETVPVARVLIRTRNRAEVPVIFILDSGATTSLLPSIDAEVLGLDITLGQRITVGGVTGEAMIGYRHYLEMDIEGFRIPDVPVIFAQRPDVPRVLGREGVFPHFGILFDENKHLVGFLERRSERKTIERVLAG